MTECICRNRHSDDYVGPHDDDCPSARILGVGRIEDLTRDPHLDADWFRATHSTGGSLHTHFIGGVPDQEDPDQVVRDFINSHTLAYNMERVGLSYIDEDGEGSPMYRHQAGPACPHCVALAALDRIQELNREQIHNLLIMIQEQGIRANKAEQERDACSVQLHDQKQHELGQMCAAQNEKLQDISEYRDQLVKLPATKGIALVLTEILDG